VCVLCCVEHAFTVCSIAVQHVAMVGVVCDERYGAASRGSSTRFDIYFSLSLSHVDCNRDAAAYACWAVARATPVLVLLLLLLLSFC
jgi:hypothetical protein